MNYHKITRPAFFVHDLLLREKEKAPETPMLFSAPSGTRTLDTLIKSQVLYQLS